jgi:hypothetical protein
MPARRANLDRWLFAGQGTIDRTLINAWHDNHVHDEITRPGRNKIIIAAPVSDVCVQGPDLTFPPSVASSAGRR